MHFVIVRFTIEKVDSNGDDIALVRLPRLAITINEDPEENVLPVCVPWTGNELVIFLIHVSFFDMTKLTQGVEFAILAKDFYCSISLCNVYIGYTYCC